jgi:hypothetical protein
MTAIPFTLPALNVAAFNCPFCHAFANQIWGNLQANLEGGLGSQAMSGFRVFRCARCGDYGFWQNSKQLHPRESSAPLPNTDLPEDIAADFQEARDILNRSPRGAAASLRLAVQKLSAHLGGKGENINEDIKKLVKDGLPVKVQQALDTVRVIGNNAGTLGRWISRMMW